MAPRAVRTWELLLGAASFGGPLLLFALTLAPTVTFEDAGELIVAAGKLGIGHPPGYPVAALAGQLLTLAPAGTTAGRVNAASAVAAAAACFLWFLWLRDQLREGSPEARLPAAGAAAAGAGLVAAGFTFWSQAVIAEVYAFNALAVAATWFAGGRFARSGEARWGYAAAFLAGIALGTHFSSLLLTLPLAGYLALRFRRSATVRGLSFAAALGLTGVFVYLYLPLRAAQTPAINWGAPDTLGALAHHLLRRDTGGVSLTRLQFLPTHLLELARLSWREFAPPAALAALGGMAWAGARRLRPWAFPAATMAIAGPAATLVLVLLLRGDQVGGIRVWYLPFFMLASGFAALAFFELLRRAGRWRAVAAVAVAAAVALPAALHFPGNDYRRYYLAEDFASNHLRTMAYRGVTLFFEPSFGMFELAYLKNCLGRRPDTKFVDALLSVFYDYERFGRERWQCRTPAEVRELETAFETALLRASAAQPVYYNYYRYPVVEYGYRLYPAGTLFRASGRAYRRLPFPAVWSRYARRGVDEVERKPASRRWRRDVSARAAVCHYLLMETWQHFGAGQSEQAYETLRSLEAVAAGLAEPLQNVGSMYLVHGRPEKALELYDRAIAAFPREGKGDPYYRYYFAQLYNDKATAYLMMGDPARAQEYVTKSLEIYPDQPGATGKLGALPEAGGGGSQPP